jgi:hypothetical protein
MTGIELLQRAVAFWYDARGTVSLGKLQLIGTHIFFGTPYRATDHSAWEDLVYNIVLASADKDARKGMTRSVHKWCKALTELSQQFSEVVGNYSTVNIAQDEGSLEPGIHVCVCSSFGSFWSFQSLCTLSLSSTNPAVLPCGTQDT